jgi:hypothetical protein
VPDDAASQHGSRLHVPRAGPTTSASGWGLPDASYRHTTTWSSPATGSQKSATSVTPAGVVRQMSSSLLGSEFLMASADWREAAGGWQPAAGSGVQPNVAKT